jgi:hypothetical protein
MTSKSGGNGGKWCNVGNKNKANDEGGQEGAGIGDTGGNCGQVTSENGSNCGRSNATTTNKANEDDVMQSYNAKTRYIEVRFVTGNSKGINVA